MDMKSKKRIIIKLGTSTLTHKTGRLNIRRVEKLVKIIADIKNSGREVILVSSGSIGLGMGKLGMTSKPVDTPTKQACAAVGQCELMYMYDKMFSDYNLVVAQLLLTKYVLLEGRRKNVENAVETLLQKGVIPIVNENDTVAIDELELEMGENDSLAATVATIVGADLLIILSDIDGLYDKNPKENADAKLISNVSEITEELKKNAGGSGSALGSGGMKTKLKAAKIAMDAGIDMAILNGRNPDSLYDLLEGKNVGTYFSADN
ncbi:MAG: glutamate 5-kinase [Ruminococcus sp.]|nr:glutamate 5-kinase [Ruminococcus sp.]